VPAPSRVDGWLIVAGVVALSATAVLAQAPQPPAGSLFRTGIDVVVVEATVLDRDGAVFQGLRPADFSVEINGKPREVVAADLVRHESAGAETAATSPEITSNQQAVAGRTILIVVDHISLRTENRAVLDTAKKWVATLGPTDRVGLMALPQPGLNIEFTTDHAQVIEGLARIKPLAASPPTFSRHNVSPWEAVRMWEGDVFVREEVVARECDGESVCTSEIDMLVRSLKMDMESTVVPVIRSLQAVIEAMHVLPGPKHVLLLSSGWLMSQQEAATELATVARGAALSNVTVHTFTAEPPSPLASRSKAPPVWIGPHRDLPVMNVETLSGMTGGRAVRLVGRADLAFASLTAGLGGYYRLGVRALPEARR
jgi:VWFA-related protein